MKYWELETEVSIFEAFCKDELRKCECGGNPYMHVFGLEDTDSKEGIVGVLCDKYYCPRKSITCYKTVDEAKAGWNNGGYKLSEFEKED